MALADFNDDGRTDVAAMGLGTVRVLFGNGRGLFAPPRRGVVLPTGGFGARGLSAADFNGDTRADLVLSGDDNGDAFVYLGDGAGSFRLAPGTPEYIGIYPSAAAALGDFDGDRRPDLLGLRGGGAPALRVLHNTGRTPRRKYAQRITIARPQPAEVDRGQPVVLSARLRCHPARVALYRRLLHRSRAQWRRLATARTDVRGFATLSDQPRVSSEYQWRPTGRGKGRVKPTRRVTVRVIRRPDTVR